MKILIVNTSDIQGGAARAAYRLHQSLLEQDIDSQMLVQNKSSDDYRALAVSQTKLQKVISKLRPHIDSIPVKFYKNRTKTAFSPANIPFSNIVDRINEINPDIVNLQWICGGLIKIEDLLKIKAPIIWTLHDMWAFTGGCHYDENCFGYEKTCGNCPVLGSNKVNDLSKKIFNQLKDMRIVNVSNWLTNCTKKSTLLGNHKSMTIPNPLNTNKYKIYDKNETRRLWNLPKNKKLVLFGAIGGSKDFRKGYKELKESLYKLKIKDIEFVVFGSSEPEESENLGFKTHYFGHLHDDVSLITLYNSVDVMIVPSLQEAFGQTASEAMSCGVPVVAFGTTGLLDIVEHKVNGYLATPFDTDDLAQGIEWILNNKEYSKLTINARNKIVNEFDNAVVAKQYIKLYNDVLK